MSKHPYQVSWINSAGLGVEPLITSAVGRNVQVVIYIDDLLNREADGTLKKSAEAGISSLINAGAKVTVVSGIHNKTLARDTNLIAEGSFNWLSAVRTAGGTHQREERTMIVEGDEVASMIEKELSALLTKRSGVQSVDKAEVTVVKKRSFVRFWVGLLFFMWLSYLLLSYSEWIALFLLGGVCITAIVGLLAQIECYAARFAANSTQRALYSKGTDAEGFSIPSTSSSPMDNPIHINTLGAYATVFDQDDSGSSGCSMDPFSD